MKLDDPLFRKIFGKKELIIIKKQINGMVLTQSEKNRLSRDIRKKFEAIKMLARIDIKLEKNEYNKRIISKSVELIKKSRKDIKAILLFGSHADRTHRIDSDIDIGVVFDKDLSIREATLFRKELMAELHDKVDLQVFNVLPLAVKKGISDNNKVLYKSGFNKDLFDIEIWKRYFDFKNSVRCYFEI